MGNDAHSTASPGFDFFEAGELAVPTLDDAEVVELLRAHFGLDAVVEPVGSQQDQNFLVRDAEGDALGILKISNPAFSANEIEAQDAAASVIAAMHPDLRVATVLRDAAGTPLARVLPTREGMRSLRLLAFLPGGTLTSRPYLSPAVVARMGALAAATSLALRDFTHTGTDRVLQWNLVHAERVVDLLSPYVSDVDRRTSVQDAAAAAWAAITAVADDLPLQPGHFDLTDDNLVGDPRTGLPDGLIDFGDVSDSWAVAELAVSISSVLHHSGGEPHTVLPAVRAFHERRPLSPAEARALWPLVVMRGAVLVVSGEQQLAVDEDNDYAAAGIEREWRIFERATSVPLEVMTALVCDAVGVDADAAEAPRAPLAPGLVGAVETLDLSVLSDAANDGAWLAGDVAGTAAANRDARTAVTRFADVRVDGIRALSSESSATIATGVDVWFDEATVIVSPVVGAIVSAGPTVVIRHAGGDVVVTGLADGPEIGTEVGVGTVLGTATHLFVQLRRPGAPEVPRLVRPEYAVGWLACVTDPTPLVTGERSSPRSADDLLERRVRSLAEVQEHYYDTPPRIERGWRHHLIDVDGRAYLDMVNNVTAIGHAHPRVATAVAQQLQRLNTNSRFHYGAIVEFSERLAATLPEHLDTVFLVNSGSEAIDLSLRIAMAASGYRDIVSVREAYHGWTYASDAVSTSIADNPAALQTRPEWVHTVEAPNSFRGSHRGADSALYALEAAAAIGRLAATGRPPAGFIAESVYGNAGGIALPPGYLATVYEAIHRVGGFTIADEVQVGYGRLGEWFWGFEQQEVVPDIVAVAKSMGNGHPLGAVITSQAVADAYRTQGYFFSSTGGSPVSSVVGLTVLDVIRDEALQENARVVGAQLKRSIEALGERHPLLGAVHGSGLYLGAELVRDRATLEPATAETAAICDRLLELGVIMQPTGDHQNVLKIKPPLCLDVEAAGFFVAMLDRTLDELGY